MNSQCSTQICCIQLTYFKQGYQSPAWALYTELTKQLLLISSIGPPFRVRTGKHSFTVVSVLFERFQKVVLGNCCLAIQPLGSTRFYLVPHVFQHLHESRGLGCYQCGDDIQLYPVSPVIPRRLWHLRTSALKKFWYRRGIIN